VGLPDIIVSNRYTRFTTSVWMALHAALGASLIFGSLHHHTTTRKVKCVNGDIADVLRAFAGNHSDDRPEIVPLVEFAIGLGLHAVLRQPWPAPTPPGPSPRPMSTQPG
jgi:hypothetical protein